MQVVVLFFVLIAIATVNSVPTESLIYEVSKSPVKETKSNIDRDTSEPKPAINPIQEGKDGDSGTRHKKSATTTFCVEIRPSDPYQKPYEVCESGNRIYTVPIESNSDYKAPSSPYAAAVPHSTSQTYSKPAYSAPKPSPSFATVSNAAFSSSTKTESNYPKQNHYGTYRSGDESAEEMDMDDFEQVGNDMLEENEEMENMHPLMRSADYGYGGGYGYGYGGGYGEGGHGATLIKFKGAGKKKKKGNDDDNEHHGHGLVITCQPSLAGYASGVHEPIGGGGMSGHGGGYGGHGHYAGYRTSSGRSSPKYRSKYYGPHNVGGDEYARPGGYGYGVGKHGGSSKSQYGGSSFVNNGGYYSPHSYRGGHRPYVNGASSSFSSTSNAFNHASAYEPAGSHGGGGYSAPIYPVSSVYSQSPPQSPYPPPPPPPYNPPNPPPPYNPPNAPPASYHTYNTAPAISSGFSSASAASSSYVPPGTYRSSENNADSSIMKRPIDSEEKAMERPASTLQHDDKDKTSLANINKSQHSRNPNMWNGNTRGNAMQSENMQEEMKQDHQSHMGGNSKWATESETNANSMSDNKPKV